MRNGSMGSPYFSTPFYMWSPTSTEWNFVCLSENNHHYYFPTLGGCSASRRWGNQRWNALQYAQGVSWSMAQNCLALFSTRCKSSSLRWELWGENFLSLWNTFPPRCLIFFPPFSSQHLIKRYTNIPGDDTSNLHIPIKPISLSLSFDDLEMETFLMHGFPSNRYVRRERGEPCQFSYAIWNNRSIAPHCSYVFKSGKALYYDLSSEYFTAMGKLAAGEILSLSLFMEQRKALV